MKAITYTQYGSPDVVQLSETTKPVPQDNEILLRVCAAAVNPHDFHSMRGKPYILRAQMGWRQPKNTRLGLDVAGQVEAVGKNVTEFQPGDELYGVRSGSFAEYICTTGKAFAPKPTNLTFEQAAAVPVAALTALHGLRDKGQLKTGQKVLINGASGGVGTFAVQIAKVLGAEVTAVCSTRNLAMVRALGADQVIDYTKENFTQRRERYDLFFDTVGNHSLSACRRVIKPTGAYVTIAGSPRRLLQLLVWSRFARQRLVFYMAPTRKEDLVFLKELIEADKITPVIDRCYSLAEVPEAIGYLGEGHAQGKVVIAVP
ncbi:MAG: NAD(P)-dependent alcohol dehydrogenase [Chloroflexi bacterium]|nr:NAD(P)-dependent alcohol dehydrogenase [Chloroflexota bacterium]